MAQVKLKLDRTCMDIESYMKTIPWTDSEHPEVKEKSYNAYRLTIPISTEEGNTLEIRDDGLYASGDPATCGLQLVAPQIHEGLRVGYYSEWNPNTEGHNSSRISCNSIVHKTWTADDIQGTNLRGVNPNDQRRESDLDGDHGTGTKSSDTNQQTQQEVQPQSANTDNGVTDVLPRASDDAANVIFRVKVKPGSHMYDINGTTVTERTGPKSTFPTPATTVYRIKEVTKIDSTYYVHQSINGGWWAIIPLELVPSEYREPEDSGGTPTPPEEETNPYDCMDAILPGDFLRIKLNDIIDNTNEGDRYDYYIITKLKKDGTIDQVVKIMENIPDSVALHNFKPDDAEDEDSDDPTPTPTPTVQTKAQPVIQIQYNEKVIECVPITINESDYDAGLTENYYALRLSNEKNNGLKIDENGALVAIAKRSDDAGYSTYYPGNGIKDGADGVYQPMEIIRCNSTVSRVQSGDPLPSNEGVNTNTLVLTLLESIREEET